MAVYAIGDIQGCLQDLYALLEEVNFDSDTDRLWFTGDLVNRGPESLETLRFVRDLGESALTVLGNHDLHLLAVAEGHATLKRRDTLEPILQAPDRDELLHWLRHQPLLHHDDQLGFTLLHAGLPPQWDLAQAQACAAEAEAVLQGEEYADFIAHMYGDEPNCWDEGVQGWDRIRFIINAFTRTRYCTAEGVLDFKAKGEPGSQPDGLMPWFEVPGRKSEGMEILFGHWSTLGLYRRKGITALDTGCLWGGLLTAMHLACDRAIFSVNCAGVCEPQEK
jgi:bis(5'-nucleosyl)-tetraphosphatase (symmetrical)